MAEYYDVVAEAATTPQTRAMRLLNEPIAMVAQSRSGPGKSEYSVVSDIADLGGEGDADEPAYADTASSPYTNVLSATAPAPAAEERERPGPRLRKIKADWMALDNALTSWLQTNAPAPSPSVRGLSGYYRLEAMDAKHRMGDLLRIVFAHWRKMGKGMGFLEFCDSLKPGEVARIFSGFSPDPATDARIQRQYVLAFYHGVEYMTAAARKSYRLKPRDGVLYYEGAPFDTAEMSTVFSGPGVAIFVMDERGRFYAGSHVKGELHHSSFLAGGGVKAAGELAATSGKLTMISGKSGHYKPEMRDLLEAVKALDKMGIPVRAAKVRLYRKGPDGQPLKDGDGTQKDAFTGRPVRSGGSVPVYVSGWEFLSGDAPRKYSAWGH